jgi:hypothetical protein
METAAHPPGRAGRQEGSIAMLVTATEETDIDAAAPESYLRNCVIIPRRGDKLFVKVGERTVLARLDGYVVLPTEQYHALISQP